MWNMFLLHVEHNPIACRTRSCCMWNTILLHVEHKSVACGT
uniref:Uncharacterized protein n=1 Tax=Anguilla anguilla TaxID=7936 RepID=A0A0E9VQ39_ANGAN